MNPTRATRVPRDATRDAPGCSGRIGVVLAAVSRKKLALSLAAAALGAAAALAAPGCSAAGDHDAGVRPPIQCGQETCAPGQLCATITAGHVCDTNPDAGIGEYAVLRTYCMTPPAACGARPSCDCITGCALASGEGRPCLNVEDGHVSCGCF